MRGGKQRWRKAAVFAAVYCACTSPCWGVAGVIAVRERFMPWVGTERFDAAGWHAADPRDNTRLRMARDLRGRGVLIGKTVAEVEALLGNPAPTDTARPHEFTHYYRVGTDELSLLPRMVFLKVGFLGGRVVAVEYARS